MYAEIHLPCVIFRLYNMRVFKTGYHIILYYTYYLCIINVKTDKLKTDQTNFYVLFFFLIYNYLKLLVYIGTCIRNI